MNITSVGTINGLNGIENPIKKISQENNNKSFETFFQSAMDMVKETETFINKAEEEEIKYAMGYADNANDLMVAQKKANISLQYTVAVRNKVLEAYKEIMNMQF